MRKRLTQNTFLLPLIMISLQCCYLFVALFGSGFFFEKTVLTVAALLLLIWGGCFIVSALRRKNFSINLLNILLIVICIVFCMEFIRFSWFGIYLRLDATRNFFEGITFIDTLYHSAIAESILTNGYPSIQQNAPTALGYHCLSHIAVAGISGLLRLPCFITYNYLFPLIFIPVFLFLMQRVLLIGKGCFSGISEIRFVEYVILLAAAGGFFTKGIQKFIGCNINVGIYNSESTLVSLILILTYFCLISAGYKKHCISENINLWIIIPVFIVLLSAAKISTGFIFASGACYYLFRKYIFRDRKFFLIFLYIAVFILYYFLINKLSVKYPAPSGNIENNIEKVSTLFHYVKSYCNGMPGAVLHYLFLFFPCVVLLFTDKKIISPGFIKNRESIFQEMIFLLMVGACLPGILLTIHGGSAFYFVLPVYISAWLMFLSCDIPYRFVKYSILSHIPLLDFKGTFNFYKLNRNIKIRSRDILLTFIIVCLILLGCKNILFEKNIKNILQARISTHQFKKDIIGNMKKYFNKEDPARLYSMEYLLFNDLSAKIRQNKKDYCVFLTEESDFINKYDDILLKYESYSQVYLIRPYLAVSAYLGIPVLNSVYEKNINDITYFYRGDGRPFGDRSRFQAYSIPPAVCKEKVTEENMIERARELGKKYIVVIRQNSYSIVNVN